MGLNPDDSQPISSYRQREDFSSGDSSGLDQDVAILFIGLTVDVVDGVVLGLVRSEEGDLETNVSKLSANSNSIIPYQVKFEEFTK